MHEALTLLASFGGFASILLIIAGTAAGPGRASVAKRLAQIGRRVTARDEDLRQPLVERVWRPLIGGMAAPIARWTPVRVSERLQQTITYAGLSGAIDLPSFMALRVLATLGTALVTTAVLLVGTADTLGSGAVGLGLGAVAYLVPTQWLKGKAKHRQEAIRAELPDTLDLLLLCLEAMPQERALTRIIEQAKGPLREELQRLRAETMLLARHDALHAFADRIGVPEIRSLVGALIQSEQLGSELAQLLDVLAQDIRVQRRQRAETMAREAPIKMLFPLVLLILPPLFIVILGPAVPQVLKSIAPGIHL